jgi:hypothetical protein
MKSTLIAAAGLCLVLRVPCFADTVLDCMFQARLNTFFGIWNRSQEDAYIQQCWGGIPVPTPFGDAMLNGNSLVADLPLGTPSTLTFQFLDPATGTADRSIAIGSVVYLVNEDPTAPRFLPVGLSSDAASNFAVSYTINGAEPMIEAIPFDGNGSPIVIPDANRGNAARGLVADINGQAAPEASTSILLGLGLMGVGMIRRRGRALTRT